MRISLFMQFLLWFDELLNRFRKPKPLSFGEKYNRMIERLELEALLKKKGFHFD